MRLKPRAYNVAQSACADINGNNTIPPLTLPPADVILRATTHTRGARMQPQPEGSILDPRFPPAKRAKRL